MCPDKHDTVENKRTIRQTHMPDALLVEEQKIAALMQAQAHLSPAAGCVAGLRDLFGGFFKDL